MEINYPNGKRYFNQDTQYGNRGMTLEEDINASNEYYLAMGSAVIHKKPTPVQVVNVDFPKRSAAVIREAYFQKPSTTDYNGVYRGKYIDFEAKETKQKTSFPLKNFHGHQIEHIRNVLKQGGICFVLLRFSTLSKVYYLEAAHLLHYWDEQHGDGRKSIKIREIEENGHLIPLGYRPRIDYLKIVDTMYFD